MKLRFRPLLVVAALMLIAAPASAKTSAKSDMVRLSQMRLFDLGYYVGPYDGVAGPTTSVAIRDFQNANHLPATGKLSQQTYDRLVQLDYRQHNGISVAASDLAKPGSPNMWQLTGSKMIPTRYGQLSVDDESMGEIHRYSIKLDGKQFLLADNQPAPLAISKVFQLRGEDALVITAFRGQKDCVYKNFLVTVRQDSSTASTREFQSCSPSNEVHQAFAALFVRFAGTMNHGVYDSWDVWRYEDAKLQRM